MTIMQRFSFSRLTLLLACLLLPGLVQAATYTFGQGFFSTHSPPPCQGGTWSNPNSGSTYICSGRVVLAAGDVVIVSTAWFEPLDNIVIRAAGGFTLAGNSIGTSGKNISLETDYSTITATGTNNINGSVKGGSGNVSLTAGTITGSLETASGSITLNGTTVNGTLTSSGPNNLTNATIGGAAQITSTLVATSTTFGSSVTTSGTASLIAGSVAGALSSGGNITTTNGTTIGGAVTSTNGTVSLGGGSVGGKVTGTNGVTSSNTNITGDVVATGGTINLTGGTINGNISGACCQVTLSGLTLNGNASATNNNLVVNNSTVTGNLTSTNTTTLGSTNVTGDVTAASWSTITGTGNSKVVGTCTPSLTSPTDLCEAVPVPTCVSDNFNRTALGTSDWAVTSRRGTFGVPKIVTNRLRLTDDSTEVATAVTFQRLFPAANNLITVSFDYNGYSNKSTRGADGIALILSDSAITPQPGAYGGSLGYAQKTGISGFDGGWLGIGLDEFGNYSAAAEGRVGGPAVRADAVAIRGSTASSYAYLTGTNTLSPEVDASNATTNASPGHRYRITIDSRTSGKTLVTVERDTTGTGNSFSTLISSYDVRASGVQGSVPQNFWVSFTGSTGSYANNHDLDNLQICANRMNTIGAQIDHFEYVYSGTALTCNPQPITIKACLNSSCSSLYTDPVSVTMSPSAGWTATAPATVTGSNVINFSGGTATVQLRSGAGEVTIGESSSVPAVRPLTQRVCSTSGCKITYADSGFLINVPDMIAGKPVDGTIQAVRKADNSAICVPGFANVSRGIRFNASYSDPSSGTKSVVVNNSSVTTTTSAAAATATPTTLNLDFDANGRAPLSVRYNDAGQMNLNASYVDTTANLGSSGYLISGSTSFVSRPYGLCIQTDSPTDQATSSNYAFDSPRFSSTIRAGDLFDVRLKPVIWTSATDSSPPLMAANICNNETTPNYQQADVALSTVLLAPVGGVNATLGNAGLPADPDPAKYAHSGASTTVQRSVSEVGVFRIVATPPAYLGRSMTHALSYSDRVGRFAPAYLNVALAAELPPSCGIPTASGSFSYQGQPIVPKTTSELTIEGRNRQGSVTLNYDLFWRFSTVPGHRYFSSTGRSEIDSRVRIAPPYEACVAADSPSLCQAVRLSSQTALVLSSDATPKDGKRAFALSGQLRYLKPTSPSSQDSPFDGKVQMFIDKSKLVDDDSTSYSQDKGITSVDFLSSVVDAGKVRLGRLRTENVAAPDVAVGSNTKPVAVMPIPLEQWSGSSWAQAADSCTGLSAVPGKYQYIGNLTQVSLGAWDKMRLPVVAEQGQNNQLNGAATLRFEVTSTFQGGSALSAAFWLCNKRDTETMSSGGICSFTETGITADAAATATFGIYRGSTPLIYRREVYR